MVYVSAKGTKVLLNSKKHITAVIRLMVSQPWLTERADALDFLQAECKSDAELELVFDLLSRFDYLGSSELSSGFNAMVDQILGPWNLDPASTIICPPKVDSSADSGPAVVQTLKTILGKRNIRDFELVISINKIKDHAARRSKIVLVDDFAGTGKTINNKLQAIRALPAYQANSPEIYVCLIAAAATARQALAPSVTGYFAWREYARGISDHYREAELERAKDTMKGIEGRLASEVRGVKIPCFGYGETEVLMGWDANLPNSVFPVFWWPEAALQPDGRTEARKTLFSRYF